MKYNAFTKYLTDEEFKSILHYVSKLESPSMKACIRTLCFTGLRIGDCVKLRRSNFNEDFSTLHIVMEKTKKNLSITLPSFLSCYLEDYYEYHKECMVNDYLFFASCRNQSENSYLQTSSVQMVFSTMRKVKGWDNPYMITKSGIPLYRISCHTIRHYVCYRIAKTSNLTNAMEWLGHSDINITAHYSKANEIANNGKEIINKAFTY